jgi:hypothetical protein
MVNANLEPKIVTNAPQRSLDGRSRMLHSQPPYSHEVQSLYKHTILLQLTMPAIGPELSPPLMKRKRSSDSSFDDADKSLLSPSKFQAASPEKLPGLPRVFGPALPPAPLDQRPIDLEANREEEDSSSSDEDYGPSLPSASDCAVTREAERESQTREEAAADLEETEKPQREEWMLAPPIDFDWCSRVDPTKLKSRKFASGKGAKAPAEKTGVSAIWTETPEQKRRRIEDEVMGRKDLSTQAVAKRPSKNDAEAKSTARKLQEYNEKNRGQSLMEQHKNAVPKEKEDDPSMRAFDKEKDMALGGRIGQVQKKQLLKQAGDFQSRFERGSYL